MDKTPAQPQPQPQPQKVQTQTSTVRRSTRKSNPPKRFEDEKFVPGSNNAYTAGRVIDAYDKDYWEKS
jgi:hypothetical protein